MIALSTQTLEDNLWLLPAATQKALRDSSGQPEVALLHGDGADKAAVRTAEGRLVPLPTATDFGAASRIAANGGSPPLVIAVGLGLGHLLDHLEQRHPGTRVLAIEPVKGLTRAMLARRDWDSWLQTGRLTLLVGPEYPDSEMVPRLLSRAPSLPPIVLSPLLQREFPDETAGATLLLRRILGSLPNAQRRAS